MTTRDVRRGRAWSVTRFMVILGVASWAGLVTGLAPCSPAGLAMAFVTATVALAVGWLLLKLVAGDAAGRAGSVLVVTLFKASLVIGLVESGLRLAGAVLPPSPQWLPASSSVDDQLDAYRFTPGAVLWGFPSNSLGYYDREPVDVQSGRQWVACVGDSFIAGAVPWPLLYTTVAGQEPGVAVHGFGVHAAGPREYLEILRRDVLPREPDAVVVSLFVGNDITDCWRADSTWFTRVFHPRNARLMYVPKRYWIYNGPGPGHPGAPRGRVEGDSIVVNAPQGQLRGTIRQLIDAMPTIAPWAFDPDLENPTYSAEQHLGIECDRAAEICRMASTSWPTFFRLLDELLGECRDTPVVVVILPDEFQVDDELWKRVTDSLNVTDLERDLPQRRISEFLRARSVPYLDVLPALREAAEDGERLYLIQNTHLNRRGNEIVGHRLAEFLSDVVPRK